MKIDEEQLYKVIGSKLRMRRNEKEVTQSKLAKAVSVRRTSITNIESGIQKLPISLLFEICNILEIEPSEIIPSMENVKWGMEEIVDEATGETERVPTRTASAIRDVMADINGKDK